jgi:hypothetical protein
MTQPHRIERESKMLNFRSRTMDGWTIKEEYPTDFRARCACGVAQAGSQDRMNPLAPRQRPQVDDATARRVLDWVDTLAYVFWVLFSIAAAVIVLIHATQTAGEGLDALSHLRP